LNEEGISKLFKIKVEGKFPRGRLRLRWGQQVSKYVTQRKGRPWEEIQEEMWEVRDRDGEA
jgi:hypothetical protein